MPIFKPRRPDVIAPALPYAAPLTLHERRAAAFERVWPLLSTSIPTADICASYLDEVVPS